MHSSIKYLAFKNIWQMTFQCSFFAAIKGEMSSLRLCACVCMHGYSINFGAVLDFSFMCVCVQACASFIIEALFLSSQSVCVYLQLLSDRATHGVKATTFCCVHLKDKLLPPLFVNNDTKDKARRWQFVKYGALRKIDRAGTSPVLGDCSERGFGFSNQSCHD